MINSGQRPEGGQCDTRRAVRKGARLGTVWHGLERLAPALAQWTSLKTLPRLFYGGIGETEGRGAPWEV